MRRRPTGPHYSRWFTRRPVVLPSQPGGRSLVGARRTRANSIEGPFAIEAQARTVVRQTPAMNTQLRVGLRFPAPALVVQCDAEPRHG
jgi:hypothetical protein